MITQAQANAITEYKRRERLTRQKFLNSLLIALEAKHDMTALDTATLPGGDISDAREFYESQVSSNPQFGALIAAMESEIEQLHAIMWQAQQVDNSLFFGGVPTYPGE